MLYTLAAAGIALFGLILWCVGREATDRRHDIFVLVAIVLVGEALIAGPAADVPYGLLRPRVGAIDIRLIDIFLVAALAARVVSISSQRISRPALALASFVGVYVMGVVAGFLHRIDTQDVLYQGKAAFYLVGGAVVASGLDSRKLIANLRRAAPWIACVVPFAFVAGLLKLDWSFDTPIQRFNRPGRLSNDSISIVVLIGALVAFVESVRRDRRRPATMVAALVLLLSPLAGQQRASYLVLASVLGVFGLFMLGSTWKRRTSVTGTEFGLIGAGLVGLVVTGFLITSSPGVIVEPITNAFSGEAEVRSAESRISLLDQAVEKIEKHPVIGSGVGTKVIRKAALSSKEVEAAAHNLVLDISMRVGLFGLAVFGYAVLVARRDALTVWRRTTSWSTAAVAGGSLLVMVGILTKGMVEPALDKFRLSVTLGLAFGLVMAVVREFEAELAAKEADAAAVAGSTTETR